MNEYSLQDIILRSTRIIYNSSSCTLVFLSIYLHLKTYTLNLT